MWLFHVPSDKELCVASGCGRISLSRKTEDVHIHLHCHNGSKDFRISTQHTCFLLKEHVTKINYISAVPSVSLQFQVCVELQLIHHREMWLDSHSSGVLCVRLKLDLLWLHHTTYILPGNTVRSRWSKHRAERRSFTFKAGVHMLTARNCNSSNEKMFFIWSNIDANVNIYYILSQKPDLAGLIWRFKVYKQLRRSVLHVQWMIQLMDKSSHTYRRHGGRNIVISGCDSQARGHTCDPGEHLTRHKSWHIHTMH